MNAFFFAASVLYEGFRLIEKMRRCFKDTGAFQSNFTPLLRDQKVKKLWGKVLNRVRNKVVFHFDVGAVRESLSQFELPEYIFATGVGEASGEMVFQLSEEVVINYLLQPGPTDNDHTLKQRYGEIIDQTLEITGRFIEAFERLMGDALRDMGFKTKQMPFTEANEGSEGTEVRCLRSDV